MGAPVVNRWTAVAALAGRQHGVVASGQLRELGVSARAVGRAVQSGRLHRLHVGVFAVGHVPVTREARWLAAVLACGGRAVLSHRSAAALWGFRDGETARVDVATAPGSGRRRPGIAIHRSSLAEHDRTEHRAIPVTSPARTLADLAHAVDADDLARAVREAAYLRRLDLAAVAEALERRPSRALRALLADVLDTRSRLEDAFLRLIDRHRVPRPLRQRVVAGHRVDFLWPEQRLIVETDGWGAHGTRIAFQRDRAQTNALQLAGYTVLRLTPADVERRPRATAATLRRALRRR